MVKYEKEILKSFGTLGFSPRDSQVPIISDIVTAYLDWTKKNVILVAGTGIGKSIIAGVVSETLRTVQKDVKLAAIYMSSTNSLVDQYTDSFKKLPDSKFFRIKGASNYECAYFRAKGNPYATGEDCVRKELTEMEQEKFCSGCPFTEAKIMMNKSDNLITNYAYFMIAKLKSDHLAERNLQVFDEAHLLNDTFCSQVTIEFSVESLEKLCKDLSGLNGKFETEMGDLTLFKQDILFQKISSVNYREKLKELYKLYSSIEKKIFAQASLIPDMKVKVKIRKIGGKFTRLMSLISGFFSHEYEHVFDSTVKDTISIKPIFIGDSMHMLLGNHNLFMTATLSPNFAETTMKLVPSETAYVTAPDVFPPENKQLFFLGKENLNFQKMKDPATFVQMSEIIKFIVQHHSKEKGIIIAPSFYSVKSLSGNIPKTVKLFQHTQGTNVSVWVKEFKEWVGPAVLISPSIFEGLDFAGDDSRYAVIIKTPYPSLGDLRIKYIADNYSSIYKEITLYKILQGIGRSVRSPEDFASAYCLDKSTETIFKSKLNIWQDRFTINT